MRKLTLQEQKILGLVLKRMRDGLVRICCLFPKNSRAAHKARKAYQSIDALRSELDNQVGRRFPELTDEDLNQIFYPCRDRADEPERGGSRVLPESQKL